MGESPGQPQARLLRLADLLDDALVDAEDRHQARAEGKPLGALTGLPKLDTELGGALAPGLHILHGAPGTGKTAFALQAAASCRCPALFVTCEMAPVELLRRLAARVTGEYLGRFKSGEFTRATAERHFTRALEAAPMLALVDATAAPAKPGDLLDFAEATRRLAPGNPHLLIVVDSVHSWTRAWQADAPEYEALNTGLNALRETAHRLNAALLGIGERNRGSMQSGGQSAAAGTRVFEYSSETVLSLQREKDARPDAQGETDLTLTLEKNRNGYQGKTISLLFHGALQRFREENG